MLDVDESQAGNIKKDNEEEDKENIYIPTVDSYSHMVAMTRMC